LIESIVLIKSLDKAILGPIIEALKFGEKVAEQTCCTLIPDVCSLCGLIVKHL